jgi:hypothetical protein
VLRLHAFVAVALGPDGLPHFSASQWRAAHELDGKRRCLVCQRAGGVASSTLAMADAVELALVVERATQLAAEPLLLTDGSDTEFVTFQRLASSGWDDMEFCCRFNNLVLDRQVDGWQKSTRTLPIDVQAVGTLLQPFLTVSSLERTEDEWAHVLLPNGLPWTTTCQAARKKLKLKLAGYDSYDSSQDTSGSVEERDHAQRRNIVMFLPWKAWAHTFPKELLPIGFTDSALWATALQTAILGAVQQLFEKNTVPWDGTWEILYIHILNQAAGASRFRMHRDVEEDSNRLGKGNRLRVHHTVVLLLDKGDKQVPALFVAGAERMAKYSRIMTGHVFNANLFHTTEPMSDDESSGVKLGLFIGTMF